MDIVVFRDLDGNISVWSTSPNAKCIFINEDDLPEDPHNLMDYNDHIEHDGEYYNVDRVKYPHQIYPFARSYINGELVRRVGEESTIHEPDEIIQQMEDFDG